MRRTCGFFLGAFLLTGAAAAAPTTGAPAPAHVQVAAVAPRPVVHHVEPVAEPAHAEPLHTLKLTEPKIGEAPANAAPSAMSKLQKFVTVARDPSFAVSVANFAAKTALAFSHQGMPVASAAAASLGVVFAGLALWRHPREWGSLPWTTASLGFTGAAAAASLVDPSVSGYLFDAAVATSLPGIASAGKAAAASKPVAVSH